MLGTSSTSWLAVALPLTLFLSVSCHGDENLLPSGVFRDDILFDISWPGSSSEHPTKNSALGYDSQRSSEEGVIREEGKEGVIEGIGKPDENGNGVNEEEAMGLLSDSLLPEAGYDQLDYVDMRTGTNEEYRCVLPQILEWQKTW